MTDVGNRSGAVDPAKIEQVRLAVYRGFAATGAAPPDADIAALAGIDPAGVPVALAALAAERHVVLDAGGRIVMAHPFAAIPLGFSVMGRKTLWWGGCAWDSFALPQLLRAEPDVLVATKCPACETPHAWVVGRDGPPPGDQVAHFLVPAERIWADVVHSCGHQRLFCSPDCVAQWLAATGNPRGYVMDLPTLWRLAEHWYDGRLDEGYVRRDPATAAAYFRSVGLRGGFWGL